LDGVSPKAVFGVLGEQSGVSPETPVESETSGGSIEGWLT
jgi:hypothetical protein